MTNGIYHRERGRPFLAGLLLAGRLLGGGTAAALDGLTVELAAGSAHSFRTPLTIRQVGFEPLRLSARYETRPFADSPYYAVRVALWKGRAGWELQHVHHKLYLENRLPDVQRFEITHGYNLVTLSRAAARGGWTLRAGAGLVVARPETTLRGRPGAGERYQLTGPTLMLGAGRRFSLGPFLLSPEVQLSGSRARVDVESGHATAPNASVHSILALGYRFRP